MLSSSALVRRSLGALLVAAVVLAACSSDAAAPDTTLPATATTTTTVQPASSAEPSTTTTTAAPSTAPPTSRPAEIEAELIRVLDGANSVFTLDPIDPDTPLIDEFYAEEMGSTLRSSLVERVESGERYAGMFEVIGDRSVEIDGTTATVLECGLDAISIVGADGAVVSPPDAEPVLRVYTLELSSNGWKLASIGLPGDERESCDGL